MTIRDLIKKPLDEDLDEEVQAKVSSDSYLESAEIVLYLEDPLEPDDTRVIVGF